ncbi:MAG: hypothetical protein K0R08_1237, partial [Solimicrobium sp.]|nr:hypothetical protein [Solimicrobium sp.]
MQAIRTNTDHAYRALGQSAANAAQVIDKLYEAAEAAGGNEELAFSLVSSSIICHSSVLIKSDDKLPEAIFLLLMCKKSAQDLTVSINDIITVLHALKDVHSASLELIEEITRYQEGDLKLLLIKGLEHYNQKQISLEKNRVVTFKKVFSDDMRTLLIDSCLSFLNSKISPKNLFTLIPNELHTLIHSSLSWTSSISLSITCKKNYVIFERLVMPVFLTREGGNSVTSRQSAKTLFRENRDYRLCDRHKIIGQDGIDYVQH